MTDLRTDEYLRGYKAAMTYAASFARDCGAGTELAKLMEIMAEHYEEKVESTERVVAIERQMVEGLRRLGADAIERLGIELPPAA